MGEAVSNSLPLNIVTVFIPVLFYFLGLSSNLEQFKRIFIEKKYLQKIFLEIFELGYEIKYFSSLSELVETLKKKRLLSI